MKCKECKNYATTKCVICVGSNNFKSKNTMNELKIEIPQGMVIDTDNSNLANGIIKFKPVEKQLPKTWEEFCDTYPRLNNEYFIDADSQIGKNTYPGTYLRHKDRDKNLGTYETCEAILALMQLIQLRDCYNDGWVPNWTSDEDKFVIFYQLNEIAITVNMYTHRILAFKTEELRNQFLENFRNLIEIAKPLI